MGVGSPPQRAELVRKAAVPAAILLLRLQTEPVGHHAHGGCARHQHVLVPCPRAGRPGAAEFLAVEREYLTSDWSLWKVLLALLVPASFAALAVAFWKRSFVWGLAVINAMVLVKVVWSFYFGDESGGLTLLPSAVVGLAVCDAVILYVVRRMRRRSSPEPPRRVSQHGG